MLIKNNWKQSCIYRQIVFVWKVERRRCMCLPRMDVKQRLLTLSYFDCWAMRCKVERGKSLASSHRWHPFTIQHSLSEQNKGRAKRDSMLRHTHPIPPIFYTFTKYLRPSIPHLWSSLLLSYALRFLYIPPQCYFSCTTHPNLLPYKYKSFS